MVSFGEKAKIKNAGNLNKGRSYVITTVRPNVLTKDFELKGLFKHLALLTSIIVSWCAKIENVILFGILGRGIKCTRSKRAKQKLL